MSAVKPFCAEVGKTIAEARNEVRRAGNTLRLSGDAVTVLHGEVLPTAIVPGAPEKQAVITHEPAGVVGAITPFNYPLNLLCHKLGPAIAAGNAVVAKPSPKAPLAEQRLAELAAEAGFPDGLFGIVHGGADVAAMIASGRIMPRKSPVPGVPVAWAKAGVMNIQDVSSERRKGGIEAARFEFRGI